jgi:hypothetical protein
LNLPTRVRTLAPIGLGLVLTFGIAIPRAHGRDLRAVVLLRGPVHEAFAAPLIQRLQPPPVVREAPPDPIVELLPLLRPAKCKQWIPGYWAYDDAAGNYLWVTGLWRRVPPGMRWIPGSWIEVDGGWQRSPGFWFDAGQEKIRLLPQPPPPPVFDRTWIQDRSGIYVPASWVFKDGRYQWRPGFWYNPERGWFYNPARYVWTPGGWAYVKGHWDYPLARRGLLFAPASFDQEELARDAGGFRPAQVVNVLALQGALFVRPAWGGYYFGNYFGRHREKFTPWVDYRATMNADDPLFAYHCWQHRDKPHRVKHLQTLFKQRRCNKYLQPPLTLADQEVRIKEASTDGNPQQAVQDVKMLAPLEGLDATAYKLERLTKAMVAQEQKAVEGLRTAAKKRQSILAQLPRVSPVARPHDKWQVRSMSLPGAAPVARLPKGARPPELPPLPPLETKAIVPRPRPDPSDPKKPKSGTATGSRSDPKKPKSGTATGSRSDPKKPKSGTGTGSRSDPKKPKSGTATGKP